MNIDFFFTYTHFSVDLSQKFDYQEIERCSKNINVITESELTLMNATHLDHFSVKSMYCR